MDPPQATQFSSAITTHVDGPGASAAETTTKYCERCVELNRKVFISRKENFPTKRARPTHAIEDSTLDPLCAFCCQCRAFMVSLHITHIRLGIRDAKSFEVHYDDFQQQCNGYRDIFVQRRPFLHDGSPRTRQAILQLKSPHHPDYGAGADYLGKSHIWVDPLAGYRHAFAATIKRIAHLSLLKRPPDPTGFSPRRFIDCKLGKLCEDEGQYYICLSYVWGKASTLELDSPNPAVNGLPQTLPTTVADAMAVTLSLRHRYIWVDRYCIDQNNASEVHATIQGMNSIYRNAVLTIIAAAGIDSDHGLPGVSVTRDFAQTFQYDDRQWVRFCDPSQELASTRWYTRGWTYQEGLLSPRTLVFTETQSWMQDHRTLRIEGVAFQDKESFHKPDTPFPHILGYGEVYPHLEEYFGKTLTFRGDILYAFEGIGAAFWRGTPNLGTSRNHFYGIPIVRIFDNQVDSDGKTMDLVTHVPPQLFAMNLTWRINRPGTTHRSLTADCQFPTWSWASYKACSPHQPKARLYFPCTRVICPETPKAYMRGYDCLEILFHHRNGTSMILPEFVLQKDDYTKFHSYLDITTFVRVLSIELDDHQVASSAAFPDSRMQVYLHDAPETLQNEVTVAFITLAEMPHSGPTLVGLLLQEAQDEQYQVVGTIEIQIAAGGYHSEWLLPIDFFDTWTRETLRLI